jgi:hypothetical protein
LELKSGYIINPEPTRFTEKILRDNWDLIYCEECLDGKIEPVSLYYIRDWIFSIIRDAYNNSLFANRHQLAMVRDILTKRRVVSACSRGWGKTFSLSIALTMDLWHDMTAMQILGIAPSRAQARLVFNNVARFFENSEVLKQYKIDVNRGENDPRIVVYNGGAEGSVYRLAVVSKTHKGTNIHGYHPNFIYVDEAGFVPDMVYHNTIIPLTKGQLYGFGREQIISRLCEIGTPRGGVEHFKHAISNGPGYEEYSSHKYPFWTGLLYDDAKNISPALAQRFNIDLSKTVGAPGSIDEPYKQFAFRYTWKEIEEEYHKLGDDDPDWVSQYMADFGFDIGAYFSTLILDGEKLHTGTEDKNLEPHMTPHQSCDYVAGLDFGAMRDSTVLTIGYYEKNILHVVHITEIRPTTKKKMLLPQQVPVLARICKQFRVSALAFDNTGVQKFGSNEEILTNALKATGHVPKLIPYDFSIRQKTKDYSDLRTMMADGRLKYPSTTKYGMGKVEGNIRTNEFFTLRKQLLGMVWELAGTDNEETMNPYKKIHKPVGGADDYVDSLLILSTFQRFNRRIHISTAKW